MRFRSITFAKLNNNKFGKIINISSTFAFFGHAGTVPYSTAKAGIIGLTRTLAKELGPQGINVNAIAPGYVLTDLSSRVSEEERKLTISAIPLRRPAKPEEIGDVAVFLATKESSYITGQVIFVDGGWTLKLILSTVFSCRVHSEPVEKTQIWLFWVFLRTVSC